MLETAGLLSSLLSFIGENIEYAPYLIFFLLLLAGLNIPVSEDLVIFFTALLAREYPHKLVPLFLGLFIGAYISDLVSFCFGRYLGPRLWKIRSWARAVPKRKIDTVAGYYQKYGMTTLILGRFIPFGVRNALFLSAGLGKMNWAKFFAADFISCLLSTSTYFLLVYLYGETIIEKLQKTNTIIFIGFALIIAFFLIRKLSRRKKEKSS